MEEYAFPYIFWWSNLLCIPHSIFFMVFHYSLYFFYNMYTILVYRYVPHNLNSYLLVFPITLSLFYYFAAYFVLPGYFLYFPSAMKHFLLEIVFCYSFFQTIFMLDHATFPELELKIETNESIKYTWTTIKCSTPFNFFSLNSCLNFNLTIFKGEKIVRLRIFSWDVSRLFESVLSRVVFVDLSERCANTYLVWKCRRTIKRCVNAI